MQYILHVSCYRHKILHDAVIRTVEKRSPEQAKNHFRDVAKRIKREREYDRLFCTITAGEGGPVIETFILEG